MELLDAHCHLEDEKFNEDREQIIQEIKKEGITKLISAGYSVESSQKASKLADQYDFIYATAGISPNDIPQTKEELWKKIEEIKQIAMQNKKIVAIGEIGLDYYWKQDNKELQKLAFIKQMEVANELSLPIVIHSRKAEYDTIQILKQFPINKKGIFHCCSLKGDSLKQAIDLGFYLSFAGPITFKNSKNADEMIKMVPNDKILIETDSPYLSPEPHRGTRNDPRNVKFMAQKIAQVKEMEIETVAKMTYENAQKILNIK